MIPNIIYVAIVIAVLILIHEFGHLLVAKSFKVPVEKFSVGFGPALIKKKIKETTYQLSIIPLGGYIKMLGEDTEVEGGFISQPAGKKIGVVIAGPISNFILGFILTLIIFLSFGVKYVEPRINPDPSSWVEKAGLQKGDLIVRINGDSIKTFDQVGELLSQNLGETLGLVIKREDTTFQIPFFVQSETLPITPMVKPIIGRAKKGGPASRIGLKPGDEIQRFDNNSISDWEELVQIIQKSASKKIPIQWQRNGLIFQDSVIPERITDEISGEKIGQIGIWVALPQKSLSVFSAVQEAGERSVNIVVQTFVILYKIMTGKISRKAIGGPIMVAKLTYEGVGWGAEYFLALWALLSINLCVVNLLPIPVLDGGRALIFIIESIRRKRLTKKQLDIALNIGWALVLLLIFFTLFNDILRFIRP
jgi:regulator of sigma E protease